MIVSNFRSLPRLLSAHQLARRAGVHRSALTALMLRGQLQPFALQDVGNGREQFLFAADAVETVSRLSGRDAAGTASRSLL
jgi:hypothetical protein